MEKKSPLVFLISAMVIAVLIAPIYGVVAQNDNVKQIQLPCCSYIDEDEYNFHTVAKIITEPNIYI